VVFEPHEWDYCFLGNIDDSVKLICDQLGWNINEIAQEIPKSEAITLTPKQKVNVNNVSVNNIDNNMDPKPLSSEDQQK